MSKVNASYTFDAKATNSYGLLDEGEYEVYIDKMETKTLPSGAEKIGITFKVRDDIEQDFQNRLVFEDIWKERDTEYYNRKRLNQLLSTQDFEDGTTFSTVHDLIDEMIGRKLTIKVVKSHDDYRDEEVNRIAYYKQTKFADKKLGEEKYEVSKDLEVEEDLPF